MTRLPKYWTNQQKSEERALGPTQRHVKFEEEETEESSHIFTALSRGPVCFCIVYRQQHFINRSSSTVFNNYRSLSATVSAGEISRVVHDFNPVALVLAEIVKSQ